MVRDRKKRGRGSKGEPPALVGTREYKQSNPGLVAGGRVFEVLWNL